MVIAATSGSRPVGGRNLVGSAISPATGRGTSAGPGRCSPPVRASGTLDTVLLRGVPEVRRLADAATAPTSAGMLAGGDARLASLAARLPRRAAVAARAGLPLPPATPEELLARVARHRDVDFDALAAAAARLRGAADGVRRRHVALAEEAGSLWDRWAGDAADGVADGVGDVARAAHEVVETLEDAASRLEESAVTVADAVAALAAALDDLPAVTPEPADEADAVDVAVLRARAAVVDAAVHRLLAVLDRTDDVVDRAWADLAADTPAGTPDRAGAGQHPAEGAEGLDDVDAVLVELIGPVGVEGPPGREVRRPR